MTVNEIIKAISFGRFDDKLIEIYVDDRLLQKQKYRYINTLNEYKKIFGDKEVKIISSPGRTEICGNHTDHQNGIVLAAAINLDILAVVSKTEDNIIHIVTEGKKLKDVHINSLQKSDEEAGTTEALVKGVVSKLKSQGYKIGGFNAYITSEVLIGSGLSSSAAFENLIGMIISGFYNDNEINPVELAKASQYAEREYYKKPCGLMDQMASSIGGVVKIDFKNLEAPEYQKVELDLNKYNTSLCIVDTKASHEGLTGEYAAIPSEMHDVANFFNKNVLRDVDENAFYININELRKLYGDRAVLRCMHFFEENKRVLDGVDALLKNDFKAFKAIVKKSGDSSYKYLQNIYSFNNIKEQSVSIGLAMSEEILEGHGVCRVHGGGFAGTIQAFVDESHVDIYKENIEKVFGEGSCLTLKIRNYGTKIII